MQEVLGSNLDEDTGYADSNFCGLSQSLQEYSGIVPRLDHDTFLANILYSSAIIPSDAL
jgi:hypothetical protein